MLDKLLRYSFYALFFLTPLIWTPLNHELFEFNKMLFVYLLTTIILACWIIQMIKSKAFKVLRTPLDIPLLLFLAANIISTIFSTDRHLSIWGYYSRLNGGLFSTVSYIVLFYALVSNFSRLDAIKFLRAAVFGGVLVAAYAIPEHFGISPSCLILTGKFSASCWIQDVSARVFATLGQPNWLAAYLVMLIFPAFYFLLAAETKVQRVLYFSSLISLYLAFTFTYSRGATLGLLIGLGVFLPFASIYLHTRCVGSNKNSLWAGVVVSGFLVVNLLFGSALTNFSLVKKLAPPPRPIVSLTSPAPGGTQLETGGTESGKIRLIVWQGTWEVFKHYPIFGTGVETFANSYYKYRPAQHNLISEWDFLYNKAHNEFLNYLATTGVIGFGSYSIIIIIFIKFILKRLRANNLLLFSILASYVSYLVQNFFGFSVVNTALLFYLFPALAFLTADSAKELKPFRIFNFQISNLKFLYSHPWYPKLAIGSTLVLSTILALTIIRLWVADYIFTQGNKANDEANPGKAYNALTQAVSLNPYEPLYKSELAYASAASAVALSGEDATLSGKLRDQANQETESVLRNNPNNVSLFRNAVRTYYLLSVIDDLYTQKSLETLDKLMKLAPTDPKLPYNKAIILSQDAADEKVEEIRETHNEEAIKMLEKTIELKPNYRDALYALGTLYYESGEKDKAIAQMQDILKLLPQDTEALEKLKNWGVKEVEK